MIEVKFLNPDFQLGILVFDGNVLEFFHLQESNRWRVELLDSVNIKLDEKGKKHYLTVKNKISHDEVIGLFFGPEILSQVNELVAGLQNAIKYSKN